MKQVECNKCGRYFQVEGEWGYCPFCENDNMETNAKRNGDFVDLLNAEIYDLLDDFAKTEISQLKQQLALTEKALELACEDGHEFIICGEGCWFGADSPETVDYFKSLSEDGKNKSTL